MFLALILKDFEPADTTSLIILDVMLRWADVLL